MLINLIGPLLVRADLSPLRAAMESKSVEWPGESAKAIFEYEDRSVFNEDSGQPTSIDLAIIDADGRPRIFIEAKFVEQEFGGCSVFEAGDCDGRNPAADLELCYLHHIGREYWSLMRKYGIDQGAIGHDAQCILCNHYQFFREVLFAFENDGIFVLLCDERSPVFYSDGSKGQRGLMPFLLGLLPQELRHRVAQVTIQDLISEIESSGTCGWVNDFEDKYGLVE